MTNIPATATVLTFNSERGLEKCFASLSAFAEILVLDGGSSDRTLEIARRFGARVERQSETSGPIKDFTAVRRRSFALAAYDWIFWLDSDEWMDEKMGESIQRMVARDDKRIAYRAERFPIVDGCVIRHAYFSPDRVLRLTHRANAEWVQGKKVHEHLAVLPGVRVEDLAGGVFTPWQTLKEYRRKDRYYLSLAFSKPLARRPTMWVTAHAIMKNLAYSLRIFCLGIYFPLRYWRSKDALPFIYHWRFVRWHAAIAWQRLRQFIFGVRYVPPSA